MQSTTYVRGLPFVVVLTVGLLLVSLHAQQQTPEAEFRFKSGVELINVTATVSDDAGRFVPGLRQDDFAVYEDDRPQPVSHFSAERVPVSLGIALDTSGSMAGERIRGLERLSIGFSPICSMQTMNCSCITSTIALPSCRGGPPIGNYSAGLWAVSTPTAPRHCTTQSCRPFASRPQDSIGRRH